MLWSEIFEEARSRLDDEVQPYLWTTQNLIRYANQAEKDLARITRVISDESTLSICRVNVFSEDPMVILSPLILDIIHAHITSSTATPLTRKYAQELDAIIAGWRQVFGTPLVYIPEIEPSKIRLYPYFEDTDDDEIFTGSSNVSLDAAAGTITCAAGGLSIFITGNYIKLSNLSSSNNNVIVTVTNSTDTVLTVTGLLATELLTSAILRLAVDTVQLEVIRLPITPVTGANWQTASPEVPELYHMPLVNGMLKYAFLKRDSETYNVGESARFGKLFLDDISEAQGDLIVKTNTSICTPHYGAS